MQYEKRGSLWSRHKLWILLLCTLVICLLLRQYLTHPGLHAAGATVLLDILLYRYAQGTKVAADGWTARAWILLLLLAAANLLGLTAVLLENDDPYAMTVATAEGCLSVLLVLFG